MRPFIFFLYTVFVVALGMAFLYFFDIDFISAYNYVTGKTTVNPFAKLMSKNQNGTQSLFAPLNLFQPKTDPVTPTVTHQTPISVVTPVTPQPEIFTPVLPVVNPSPVIPIEVSLDSRGIADFSFIQKSNGKSFDSSKAQTNGYIRVHFPSHCRVATPVYQTPIGAYAHCEWGLKNANNEEIAHLLDTVGGFHPSFFEASQRAGRGNDYYGWIDEWAANFKPFAPFYSAQDRGNNHFDMYKKYVLEGSYTFWYQNKSNTRHTVTAGYIRSGNGENDLNTIVEPFARLETILHIQPNGDEYDDYKINTNNYVLL
jgi:hypothetical protein